MVDKCTDNTLHVKDNLVLHYLSTATYSRHYQFFSCLERQAFPNEEKNTFYLEQCVKTVKPNNAKCTETKDCPKLHKENSFSYFS